MSSCGQCRYALLQKVHALFERKQKSVADYQRLTYTAIAAECGLNRNKVAGLHARWKRNRGRIRSGAPAPYASKQMVNAAMMEALHAEKVRSDAGQVQTHDAVEGG